jgi:hypothetical protein
VPQGVLTLQCGDRLDGVGAADGGSPGFGHAEVLDLACLDELLDRARGLLDRDVGVDAVLVVQVDHVGAESTQGALDSGPDLLGPTPQAGPLSVGVEHEAELAGDHHLVAYRCQGLADELLVDEGA